MGAQVWLRCFFFQHPAHLWQLRFGSMPSTEELAALKQNMYPCLACFCAEQSCTSELSPLCFATSKVCCCVVSAGLEFPGCLWCEPDPCYSQERGICEVSSKMCCMYSEVQFPPGKDIGCGCCGVGCCRTSDDNSSENAAPTTYGGGS